MQADSVTTLTECTSAHSEERGDNMSAKIISVFNNKGGVGKSTICWNLAHVLGTKGKRIL
jgi:Mrp family chromosome partitioning ATPase